MIRRYLRLALAAAILAFATYQYIDGSWGNGIFLTLMAGFPVLLHFRNERILMALWYLRSQNFTKANSQLDALKHPDQTGFANEIRSGPSQNATGRNGHVAPTQARSPNLIDRG